MSMDDDFNFPRSFSVLFNLVEVVDTSKNENVGFYSQAKALFFEIIDIFSLFKDVKAIPEGLAKMVEEKIALRRRLREEGNYKEADKIREELSGNNIILEDRPNGETRWRLI